MGGCVKRRVSPNFGSGLSAARQLAFLLGHALKMKDLNWLSERHTKEIRAT